MQTLCMTIALMANAVIVVLEIYVFTKLTNKADILKYYTYLSNAIAMITSGIFIVVTTLNLFRDCATPLWLKGIRFCATYMLVTAMFVFTVVLLPRQKSGNLITNGDFTADLAPNRANFLLHYLCPMISTCSFLLLERHPVLTDSKWTLYGALPTLVYWSVYLFLTATHLWKDPYELSSGSRSSSSKADTLLFLLIPIMSMGLDFLLWRLNTLN